MKRFDLAKLIAFISLSFIFILGLNFNVRAGWNEFGEDVASGVYLVFVEGLGGKATIKGAIQR